MTQYLKAHPEKTLLAFVTDEINRWLADIAPEATENYVMLAAMNFVTAPSSPLSPRQRREAKRHCLVCEAFTSMPASCRPPSPLARLEFMDRLHYTGDRLIFDYRTALNPKQEPTETVQCFVCRAVVTPRQQLAPEYVYGRIARIASGQQ
jgi:hypothetical protein